MNSFHEYLRSGLGQAMMSVFAGTAAVEGLVAIWAATSRVHWFLKSLVIWCAVMLLVPIRVYEPAAVFAVGSPLVVAALVAIQLMRGRRGEPNVSDATEASPRFWLRHESIAIAVIAALIILAVEPIYEGHWWFDPI